MLWENSGIGVGVRMGPLLFLYPWKLSTHPSFPPHNSHPVSQSTGMGWEQEPSQARGPSQVREAGGALGCWGEGAGEEGA